MATAPSAGAQERGDAHIIRERVLQCVLPHAARRGLPRRLQGLLQSCARLFPWQECLLCGGYSRSQLLCGFCRRDLPAAPSHAHLQRLRRALGLDSLAARCTYRFPIDVLIWRYKYQGELALAVPLARLLPRPSGRPLLLAVPSSRQRLRERGFDAAGRLVKAYARRTGLSCIQARRTREVAPQAGLSRQQRRQQLRGVFAVPPLSGEHVLIVDDVLTSGGTLLALAAACRAAGAGGVGAMVLAVTPAPDDLPRW